MPVSSQLGMPWVASAVKVDASAAAETATPKAPTTASKTNFFIARPKKVESGHKNATGFGPDSKEVKRALDFSVSNECSDVRSDGVGLDLVGKKEEWSQQHLAAKARGDAVAIHQLENETSQPRHATLEVIRRAFETAGVELIDENGGIRLKSQVLINKNEPRSLLMLILMDNTNGRLATACRRSPAPGQKRDRGARPNAQRGDWL